MVLIRAGSMLFDITIDAAVSTDYLQPPASRRGAHSGLAYNHKRCRVNLTLRVWQCSWVI